MTWFTTLEIAEANLPELPKTKRNITERAKHEGWPSRPRRGRGGGREYPIHALPPEAAAALIQREAAQADQARKLTEVSGVGTPSLPAPNSPDLSCSLGGSGALSSTATLVDFPAVEAARLAAKEVGEALPPHRRGSRSCSGSAPSPPTVACPSRLPNSFTCRTLATG